MKNSRIIMLLMLVFVLQASAQHRLEFDSKIKQVNVFFNQALVERTSNLNLGPGSYQLVFGKLSPFIIANSVELKVPNGVVIQSVTTQKVGSGKEAKPQEIKLLEDSLERVNNELFLVQSDLESLQLQRELLLSNKQIGGTNGLKAEELEDVLGIYSAKLAEFKNSKLRLAQTEKNLIIQADALIQLLAQYTQGNLSLNQEIIAIVVVEKAVVNAPMALKYMVSEVNWLPIYDVRVNKIGAPITFVLKANITQSSGEDWQDVRLNVSDVDAHSQAVMPTIGPYFLRFEQPRVYKTMEGTYGGSRMDAPMLMEMMDSVATANLTYFTPPEIIRTPTGINFETSVPYSIPSDGRSHQVELTRFELPAVFKLMTIPKLDERLFVNTAVQCNDLLNQISAEANIYYEGSFTGTGYINRQENDTMLFTLGQEKRVVIKRSKISDQSSKSVFGGTKREKSLWQIQIINTSSEAIEIEVLDQVPVSTDKEIEVKVLQIGGALHETESGKLSWKLKLLPKQEQKLRFEYEISYPTGRLLNLF